MAAEWEMIGYRIDRDKLYGVVGSNDKSLRAAILRIAPDDDSRLQGDVEELVDEILGGELDTKHKRSYRILTEAFAEAGGRRLDSLVTYAIRDEVADTLGALGMTTLAKGWDRELGWPFEKGVANAWPSIAFWSAEELVKAEEELQTLAIADVVEDEGDAEDIADVIAALRGMVKGARGKLAGEAPLAGDGLLVYRDGEQ